MLIHQIAKMCFLIVELWADIYLCLPFRKSLAKKDRMYLQNTAHSKLKKHSSNNSLVSLDLAGSVLHIMEQLKSFSKFYWLPFW